MPKEKENNNTIWIVLFVLFTIGSAGLLGFFVYALNNEEFALQMFGPTTVPTRDPASSRSELSGSEIPDATIQNTRVPSTPRPTSRPPAEWTSTRTSRLVSVCFAFINQHLRIVEGLRFESYEPSGSGQDWVVTGSLRVNNAFGVSTKYDYRCNIEGDRADNARGRVTLY